MVHNRYYFTTYREPKGGPADFTPFNMNVLICLKHITADICGTDVLKKKKNALNAGVQFSTLSLNKSTIFLSFHSPSSVISAREIYLQCLFCHFNCSNPLNEFSENHSTCQKERGRGKKKGRDTKNLPHLTGNNSS